jgi:hypothetical protein
MYAAVRAHNTANTLLDFFSVLLRRVKSPNSITSVEAVSTARKLMVSITKC